MRPGYCTRDAVKAALDSDLTARDNAQVDRAIHSTRQRIDSLLHVAHCDPQDGTRYFPWPGDPGQRSWVLYLGEDRLVALTSATTDGTALTVGDLNLEPVNTGPPYTRVETDRDTATTYDGSTSQRNLALVGTWGLGDDQLPAGALAAALVDTTGTTVDVTNSAPIGVWSLLLCGTERMIVTAMGLLDSGQNLGGNLTASLANDTVNLTSGAAFTVGEVITIDAERMLLVDIAGNNGLVKRAWDGSTIAAHTATADIYVPRRLTVERGASGSTAATHALSAAVTVWDPPGELESLAVAEAVVQIENEQSAYARMVGSADGQREAAGRSTASIKALRDSVFSTYGRMRSAAVG